MLIPELPAGSDNRNDGGCANLRPAFPGLRVIRLSSDTRFRCASRSGAGLKTGAPSPLRTKKEPRGRMAPGFQIDLKNQFRS